MDIAADSGHDVGDSVSLLHADGRERVEQGVDVYEIESACGENAMQCSHQGWRLLRAGTIEPVDYSDPAGRRGIPQAETEPSGPAQDLVSPDGLNVHSLPNQGFRSSPGEYPLNGVSATRKGISKVENAQCAV